MEQENTSEATPAPEQSTTDSSTTDNLESIIADFFPEATSAPEEAEPAQAEAATDNEAEAPEPVATSEETAAEVEPSLISEKLARLADLEANERTQRTSTEAKYKADIEAAREDVRKSILNELMTDPQGFVDKYDVKNPGDLAMHFYRKELGDDAPQELVERTSKNDLASLERRLEAKMAEFEQKQIQARAAAEAKIVLDNYDDFTKNIPDTLKYFKREASENPQEAVNAMATVADRYIEHHGRYPTAAEAAQILNSELEKTVSKFLDFKDPEPPPQAQVPPETAKTLTETLSDELTERSTGKHSDVLLDEEERINQAVAWLDEAIPARKPRR